MKNRKKKSSHFSRAIAAAVSDFAREMSGGSGQKDKPGEEKKERRIADDTTGWGAKRA